VRRHELQPVQHARLFCDWMGLDQSGLDFLIDQARNPRHWLSDRPGRYRFAGPSTDLPPVDAALADTLPEGARFVANDRLDHGGETGYITVGKGVADPA
jgi:hypothetical protein